MKMHKVVLLCEYNGATYGDIIEVTSGIYNTMLNLGRAIPLEQYEEDVENNDLDQYEMMVIHSRITMEDNERLFTENINLKDRVDRLTEKVDNLEKKLKVDPKAEKKAYYEKNKMLKQYGKK